MAEVTFNREAGAAPAGITRFRQFRTSDGSNVTVNSFRTFAGDGLYSIADVYEITFGTILWDHCEVSSCHERRQIVSREELVLS